MIKKILISLLLTVSLLIGFVPITSISALDGWDNYIKLTIDNTDASADLEDFPVGIILSSSSGITNNDLTVVFDEVGSNYLKIAVTTNDMSTQCYVEVVSWDAVNEFAELWVNVPDVYFESNTILYLYYDNDADDNTSYVGVTGSTPGKAVWSSGYAAVYHMNDNPADSAQILDSTSNNNTGTKKGVGEPVEVAGLVGKAQSFDGSNDYIDIGSGATLGSFTQKSVEIYLPNIGGFTGTYRRVFDGGYYSSPFGDLLYLMNTTNTLYWIQKNTGGTQLVKPMVFTPNTNIYTGYSWDGTNVITFVNSGTSTGELSGTLACTAYNQIIGNYTGKITAHNGLIDEVRISSVARSADWIGATNLTLTDTFITFESIPIVATTDATGLKIFEATGNGVLLLEGTVEGVTELGFDIGTTTGVYTNEVTSEGAFSTGNYNELFEGLQDNTTYYYRAKAYNSIGWGYGSEKTFTTDNVNVLTITAVGSGDNKADLTWNIDDSVSKVLIKRGVGDYPTTSSDGSTVYTGTLLAFTDTAGYTGLELDSKTYYYRMWVYNDNDDISTTYTQTKIGGESMLFIGLFIFAGLLSFLAFYNTFPLLKLLAGAGWLAVFIYFKDNPPSMITEGDTAHTAILVILMGLAIAIPLAGLGRDISRQRQMRGGVGNNASFSEFKWRFGKDKNELDSNYVAPHRETAEEYRDKVHSALRRK